MKLKASGRSRGRPPPPSPRSGSQKQKEGIIWARNARFEEPFEALDFKILPGPF